MSGAVGSVGEPIALYKPPTAIAKKSPFTNFLAASSKAKEAIASSRFQMRSPFPVLPSLQRQRGFFERLFALDYCLSAI
jgi:hypothetical protein